MHAVHYLMFIVLLNGLLGILGWGVWSAQVVAEAESLLTVEVVAEAPKKLASRFWGVVNFCLYY